MSIQNYNEYYHDIAERFLFDIGAIATCDAHVHYVYRTDKYEDNEIYAIANNKLKQQNDFSEHNDFKNMDSEIKSILSNVAISSNCPFCEKAYNE